jgi:hypothetical protein
VKEVSEMEEEIAFLFFLEQVSCFNLFDDEGGEREGSGSR